MIKSCAYGFIISAIVFSCSTSVKIGPGNPPKIDLDGLLLTHEETYTITGKDFGEKDPVEPVLWDTVDNQPLYAGLSDGDEIPVGDGHPWLYNGNTRGGSPIDKVYYSTLREHRGLRTAHYHLDLKGYLRGRDLGDEDVPEFYMTWWVKTDHDINCGVSECASTKLTRIWEDSDGDPAHFSWTGSQIYAYTENGTTLSILQWANWGGILNEWNRLEIYINSPQGIIQANTNSLSIWDTDDYISMGHNLNRVWLIGLDPNEPDHLDPDLQFDFGEIYIDTTPARIEICKGSTWSERGHCEIQVPKEIWNDTAIKFTANKGSFATGEQLYFYVVNEAGSVNEEGIEVKFN